MPEFVYTARDISGQDVHGTIPAATKRDAMVALGKRSLFPLKVLDSSDKSTADRVVQSFLIRNRIKTEILASNLTQLADLLENGVPLLESLNFLAQQATHPLLADVLRDLHDQVADGTPFEDALASHPKVFSQLTVSMVRAGSEGAFLEEALKRVASFWSCKRS